MPPHLDIDQEFPNLLIEYMESTRDDLWGALCALEPVDTTRRSLCPRDAAAGYRVHFLNQDYLVRVENRAVRTPSGGVAATPNVEMFLLVYLLHAKDEPLSRRLVGSNGLAGGSFFFQGPHALPEPGLAASFGGNPDQLYARAAMLEGVRSGYGDASVQLQLLPRIPLTVVIWAGDEEFEARAQILFDSTAARHMPLDALGGAVSYAVHALVGE